MPILNIEIIGPLEDHLKNGLATRLANLAGAALNSRSQGTWVKLHFVPSAHYAENDGGPAAGVWPVIVTLVQGSVAEGEVLAKQVDGLAGAIASGLERPQENIHILMEAPAEGRIFFGGKAG